MMRKTLLLVSVTFICSFAIAQTTYKAFLNSDGKRINDSAKASYYVLIQKNPGDSLWFGRQYNMTDTLLTSGYYKDIRMSVPHGKFNYYRFIEPSTYKKYNPRTQKMDTIKRGGVNFIEYTGNYADGKKAGKWEKYFWMGGLMTVMTYQNDALNGPYDAYDFNTGRLIASGNMIDNLKEGEWRTFGKDGKILGTDIYKNDKVINTIQANPGELPHLGLREVPNKDTSKVEGKIFNAYVSFDLNDFVNKEISGIIADNLNGTLLLQFWIDENGKVSDIKFTRHLDKVQDGLLAKALLVCPPWNPAIKDGMPISQVVYCAITLKNSVAMLKCGNSWVAILK